MASDTVDKIKSSLSIVDVVTPYVKLTRAGKYWRGLSPFNKEKTPSFYVNVDRNSYYCFSSSQGGDMFSFIQAMEGVDFKGALKILAEKAGVEIVVDARASESRGKSDRLREMMARAEAYYTSLLTDQNSERGSTPERGSTSFGSSAYAYALERGLSEETILGWGLGEAPDAWRNLLEELQKKGYTEKELESAGLVKEADGKKGTWYDRFRNRLMFPIRDTAGRTVAFTGRALPAPARPAVGGRQGSQAGEEPAKYLNSPETDLYKKHEILFGMDKAKDAIRTRGFAILVEGQLDLLLLHQIGFTNTIALSGTALSKEHIALIKRYSDNLMFALDNDRAGLSATAKSALIALSHGMKVKAVAMPVGSDPADLCLQNPKEMTSKIAEAQNIIEFFLGIILTSAEDEHKRVLAVEKILMPLLRSIQSPMEREHFIGVVARGMGSTPDAVRGSLAHYAREQTQSPSVREEQKRATLVQATAIPEKEKRTSMLHAVVYTYPDSDLAKHVENEYSRINGAPFPDFVPDERWLFEAGLTYGQEPDIHAADDLLRMLEKIVLKEKLTQATMRLRLAEASGNKEELVTAISEYTDVEKALRTLG